jgi:hypothetical protein
VPIDAASDRHDGSRVYRIADVNGAATSKKERAALQREFREKTVRPVLENPDFATDCPDE